MTHSLEGINITNDEPISILDNCSKEVKEVFKLIMPTIHKTCDKKGSALVMDSLCIFLLSIAMETGGAEYARGLCSYMYEEIAKLDAAKGRA